MIRPIAIYLPQFHPIPENNEWWGKGFTEWTNVTKAVPRFKNHYQPHLPADLGFYDLRLHDVMKQQAELAKEYGIYGFMFYHYWFSGKQLLQKPVENWLHFKTPDFPYFLCWANENWTRRWDGQEQEVLIKQNYSDEDDIFHFKELVKYFKDERYICIDEKPVFAVYRTHLFPNIKRTAEIWRQLALEHGLKGLYLISVESIGQKMNPTQIGFDAALDFQPDFANLPNPLSGSFIDRILNKFKIKNSPYKKDCIFDYSEMVEKMLSRPTPDYKIFPGITPMWDNTARRKEGATIIKGSTPGLYAYWLKKILESFKPYSKDENFIFLNAWNEWAEGNHLEPCQKWGKQYLEVTKKIIGNA